MVNTPITRPSLGLANWMGVKTLYLKEIHRFFKIFSQTLIAPVITTLLFLAQVLFLSELILLLQKSLIHFQAIQMIFHQEDVVENKIVLQDLLF